MYIYTYTKCEMAEEDGDIIFGRKGIKRRGALRTRSVIW